MKDIWQRNENGEIKRPGADFYGWGYLREEVFEELQAYVCMLGGILDSTVNNSKPVFSDGVYLKNQYDLSIAWPVARIYGKPVGWLGFLNDDGTLRSEDPTGSSLNL